MLSNADFFDTVYVQVHRSQHCSIIVCGGVEVWSDTTLTQSIDCWRPRCDWPDVTQSVIRRRRLGWMNIAQRGAGTNRQQRGSVDKRTPTLREKRGRNQRELVFSTNIPSGMFQRELGGF